MDKYAPGPVCPYESHPPCGARDMHVYWHVRLDVATARKLTEMNQTCDASFADLQLVERRPSVRRVPEPQNRIVYLIRRDSDETAALKLKTWHPSLHEWSSIDPSSKRDCSRSGTVTTQRDLPLRQDCKRLPREEHEAQALAAQARGGLRIWDFWAASV